MEQDSARGCMHLSLSVVVCVCLNVQSVFMCVCSLY
jgi:hypothetical protein